uniref:Putative tick metalloprotease n=2 Tax=Ixodes ricinus TaxID=34613 RepID=V5GLB8_IXORI
MKIVTIFSILHTLSGVSLEDAIVFPRLLEERSEGGKQIVLVNKDLRLELQKASILSERVLLRGFFGKNMDPKMENGTELEKNLYEDRKKSSTVIMMKSEEGITLKGILNEDLKIEPLLVMQRISGKEIPHRISKIELPALNISSKSEARQVPPLLAVTCEILVLLDSVYGVAFPGLFEYLMALLAAVKLRFSLMKDPIVTLRVVGLYRLTIEEESHIFSYSSGYVLAEQSLRNLFTFLNQRPVFGGPDMFYMFAGRDLASVNGHILDASLGGLSYYGVMCAFNNVAMGEDKPGTYQGVRLTTHELGHATLNTECLAIKYEFDYFTKSGKKLPGDNFNGNMFCKAHFPSYPAIFYPQPQNQLDLLKCKVQCRVQLDVYGRYLYFELSAPEGLACYGQNATCRHGECRFW